MAVPGAETEYPATAPNLLANFVKIVSGKRLETYANATSQAFYVLRYGLEGPCKSLQQVGKEALNSSMGPCST